MSMMQLEQIVHRDPEILSGTPVFRGTRVPIRSLFDYLEGGDILDEFLRQFPTVQREQAIALGHVRQGGVNRDGVRGGHWSGGHWWKFGGIGIDQQRCQFGHSLDLHIAALEQPLVILLEQYGADQACNARVVSLSSPIRPAV
jgi:uncharacterized protein (DUF433 family)